MTAVRSRQQGVSLLIVLVMVLLTTLLTMWASRTARFNELITGNDSDYQRALEAAQAMVRDAEFDIKGQKPDGTACKSGPGYDASCRETVIDAAVDKVFFPQGTEDYQDLQSALIGRTPSCIKGICLSTNLNPEFWAENKGAKGLDEMKKVAARYGEFTGATLTKVGNPMLPSTSASDAKAWYWVEVLPYDISSAVQPGPAQTFKPDGTTPYIYRITGIAQGLKAGSQAVVQTVFVWRKVDS